jgi:aromatic-L-amino-acid/L-tryptophan decarboxylase
MNHTEELMQWGQKALEEIGAYYRDLEQFPVKSQVKPGDIKSKIPDKAPVNGESLAEMLKDFREIILPGISHWQSPSFFAYFPANNSVPSVIAEMLTAAIGAQCMKWETSPAAAELEEKMMEWLRKLTGLPEGWDGVIQDSASSSTLAAILSAREKYSNYSINEHGFRNENFRVYCSSEAHSSVEKAVKIAGLGRNKLVKVPVDNSFRMIPSALDECIRKDLKAGFRPMCVVAALGTTGSTAIDPLPEIAAICRQHDLWLHVDAAFAGSALLLPEYRWMIKGIEGADSFVFNPHKWLFTNFDCSAYFIRDRHALTRTFEILPEYLRTATQGQVNDYCDWGVQLGRRFRALKLWFVLRYYGESGLQDKLREHISLAGWLEEQIQQEPGFELLAPRTLDLLCFRYRPKHLLKEDDINTLNSNILNSLNKSGKLYLSHTKLNGKFSLRMLVGQTNVERSHVEAAWELIKETSGGMV